jgi:hypothetical protein
MTASRNTAAYQTLCALAEEIGWPEFFQDDLYFHDHDRLCGGGPGAVPEGARFAWLVRSTGTWLIDDLTAEGQNAVLRYSERNEPHRAFWWNGQRLVEIPLSTVRNRLFHEQCRRPTPSPSSNPERTHEDRA